MKQEEAHGILIYQKEQLTTYHKGKTVTFIPRLLASEVLVRDDMSGKKHKWLFADAPLKYKIALAEAKLRIEKFHEMGQKIKKERDKYRAASKLWQLRERARTLKTEKARKKAWDKFKTAFQEQFTDGSIVIVSPSVHFNTFQSGGFATTQKNADFRIHFNTGDRIMFDTGSWDTVEIYYDPCGHDNLMALELANYSCDECKRLKKDMSHKIQGGDSKNLCVDCDRKANNV